MKITFLIPLTLTVVTSVENDQVEEHEENFEAGETLTVDLIDHPQSLVGGKIREHKNIWNVQCGDGSMIYGIRREWFTIS